jgi:hypothetical protein
MTVLMKLGLEWGPNKMMTLTELSVHDFDKKKEILEDIDFEHEELLLDLWWVDSASKRKLGWFLHPRLYVLEYGQLDCF